MADACECGNEPSGSVKCGVLLDYLQTSKRLKTDSVPTRKYVSVSIRRDVFSRKIINGFLRADQSTRCLMPEQAECSAGQLTGLCVRSDCVVITYRTGKEPLNYLAASFDGNLF